VFPEEVEEVLKRHPAIRDAAVVGLADPRFGQRVCAIVELQRAAAPVPPHELVAFVKQHLADHKAPRALLIVEDLSRAPNGKLDYKALLKLAAERELAGDLALAHGTGGSLGTRHGAATLIMERE
jgi:3-oxocholest-4-en-26-oate---CoA ligase